MPHALHQKGGLMSLDSLTNGVAVAAVSSPLWLRDLGSVAGDVIPILGAVWLVVQIAHKLANWSAKHGEGKGKA